MDKSQILSEKFIRDKNYSYFTSVKGFVAVDEYFLALRDINFITESEYMEVINTNNKIWEERKHESNDE